MFSKEFMSYLINYQPDGCEVVKKEEPSVKEIRFKDCKGSNLAKVYLTLNK